MKFSSSSKIMVPALALLLTVSAFAGSDNHKASMELFNAAQVNGSQLAPGQYQVQWEGAGPNVELSIKQGKKVLAKAPARVLALNDRSSNDAVVINKNTDGSKSVSEIRFAGKKFALALGNEPPEMRSADSTK
ncbi:MAG: hypothetical protein DMG70_24790 [Acidobacteria bacterium]|nr:MAG: hypothetical protein DMG70_24790 [Acidobacteriota bacterium]PYY07749.1 MAG: hypothetical protein DMG69_18310 [Acidobacteriota bacterium]